MKVIKVKLKDLPKGRTPILSYCRKLIKDGEDYNTVLEVYREHDDPDITIRRIGDGAKLTVYEKDSGPYFSYYKKFSWSKTEDSK